MVAVAEAGEPRTIGRSERIGSVAIVSGSARRLWAGGWRTLALCLALAAFSWGLQIAGEAVGVNLAAPTIGPGYVVYILLTAAGTGLGAALAMRLFTRGPAQWLAFDRPLLTGAAVMAGMTASFALISAIYASATRDVGASAAGTAGLVVALAYLVLMFAMIRLTLWPVALVMGRRVSLGAAWRAMRKATRGTIFGYLIFAIPFVLAAVSRWPDLAAGRQPEGWWQGVFALAGSVYALAVYGMAATVYAIRIEAPATVADVFD